MGRHSRIGTWTPIAALLAVVQGCAPMIVHGPHVQGGLSGGVSAAVGGGPTYSNGDDPGPFMVGALVAHAAYGWQPACGRAPAVRLGVQTSVVAGPAADLYVQAPPRWLGAGAIGIGLLSEGGAGHGRRQMPYVQAGIANGRGLGANLVLGRYAVRGEASTYTDDERATVGWLSTELPIGTLVTTHVHYGFAKGHVRRRSLRSRDEFVDEDRWSHLGGVTFEMHRARR